MSVLFTSCAFGAVATSACGGGGSADATAAVPTVPHTTVPIKIDGAWDERDWPNTALRRQFYGSDAQLARPSSEIRLLRDESSVYVGLYAADDDLESATDAFDLVIGSVGLHLGVTGQFAPALPGVRVAVDADGTMDNQRDRDEEWKLEIAIPRDLLPTGLALVFASRCDTPVKTTQVLCGSWWGPVVLPGP